jgi:hypothetical protein
MNGVKLLPPSLPTRRPSCNTAWRVVPFFDPRGRARMRKRTNHRLARSARACVSKSRVHMRQDWECKASMCRVQARPSRTGGAHTMYSLRCRAITLSSSPVSPAECLERREKETPRSVSQAGSSVHEKCRETYDGHGLCPIRSSQLAIRNKIVFLCLVGGERIGERREVGSHARASSSTCS